MGLQDMHRVTLHSFLPTSPGQKSAVALDPVCKMASKFSLRRAFLAVVILFLTFTLVVPPIKLQFARVDLPASALESGESQEQWMQVTEGMVYKAKAAPRNQIEKTLTNDFFSFFNNFGLESHRDGMKAKINSSKSRRLTIHSRGPVSTQSDADTRNKNSQFHAYNKTRLESSSVFQQIEPTEKEIWYRLKSKNKSITFNDLQTKMDLEQEEQELSRENSFANFNTKTNEFDGDKENLQECPVLRDELGADKEEMESKQWVPDTFDPAEALSLVQPGGIYRPTDCFQKQTMAVLVPNFHKDDAVKDLVQFLHYFLQRQHKAYMLVFATQENAVEMNRAAMINIAAMEISMRYPVDCIILHDIDSFPLNWRNDYSCKPGAVRQLLTSRDTENFIPKYMNYMGGVTAIWKEDFFRVNGMSNLYWGWGGEDDDMRIRVDEAGLKFLRTIDPVGRYRHVHRGKRSRNPLRKGLLRNTRQRFRTDGLSNLKYELTSFTSLPLYTNITARIMNDPSDATLEV